MLSRSKKAVSKLEVCNSGFTLGELTIAMIVVTLVVCITLPITISKMRKVDNVSYYLGYKTAQDIWSVVYPKVIIEDDDLASVGLGSNCKKSVYLAGMENGIKEELFKNTIMSNLIDKSKVLYKYFYAYTIDNQMGRCQCTETDPKTGEVLRTWGSDNVSYKGCMNSYGATNPAYDYDCIFTPFQTQPDPGTEEGGGDSSGDGDGDGEDPDTDSGVSPAPGIHPTPSDLCTEIKDNFNVSSAQCATPAIPSTGVTSDTFKNKTPHITFANGLNLYITEYGDIPVLSGSSDDRDKRGYVVYIDINGSNSGGVLYEDIFPFYLLESGKIVPGYSEDVISGPINKEYLKVNVLYDNYSAQSRQIKLLLKDTNFRAAACAIGYVTASGYCDGRTEYDLCKKDYHDCRMIVKEPYKFF